MHDLRQIHVGQQDEALCLVLGAGLYLPDGTRVGAEQADGKTLENDEVRVPVHIRPGLDAPPP